MNIQTLAKEMSKLGVIFDRVITKELIAAYEDVLKDMTDQQIIDASYKWQTEGKFFPRPSELIDMIQTPEQSSGEAWALVLKGIRDYQSAKLPESTMRAVNEIGGLKSLAHMNERDLDFKSREFKAAYTPDRLGELKERLDHDPQFKALGELIGRDL
ncbi:hypothetical protein LCGC14_2836470 [marine sediment metagenome]|uniref:Uncharacterized protein n=1 Tax=marine sediment metagenome TaxID=412755 RepID=A0A0F8YZ54_9ZZZZ